MMCRGMCRRDTGIYSPCFRRYHCWWDRNQTSTPSPITSSTPSPTTSTPSPITSTEKPKMSGGQIFGWIVFAITVLVAAAVGIYFMVKRCRGRQNQPDPVVRFTSMADPHPEDLWRFSWPDYPELLFLCFKTYLSCFLVNALFGPVSNSFQTSFLILFKMII